MRCVHAHAPTVRACARCADACLHACMHSAARGQPGRYCADGSSRPTTANPVKDSRAQLGQKKKEGAQPSSRSRRGAARAVKPAPPRPAGRAHAHLWKQRIVDLALTCRGDASRGMRARRPARAPPSSNPPPTNRAQGLRGQRRQPRLARCKIFGAGPCFRGESLDWTGMYDLLGLTGRPD